MTRKDVFSQMVLKNDILLRQIIKYSFDEIFVTNELGEVILASESFQNVFGITIDDIVGKNVYALEKEGILFPSSLTARILKTKQMETTIQQTPKGRKIVVSGYPIFEKEQLIGSICISRDVTELDYLKQTNAHVAKTMHKYEKELEAIRLGRETDKFEQDRMNKVFELVNKIASLDVTVLLTGESGVGKNYIAKKIHEQSNRRDEPFVEINCGAIPESLIESELFGYEEGAFTGAKKGGKKGYFEAAGRGTIFLDEISELSLNLQVKLLSVLQNYAVQRVGGHSIIHLNCRIVCATNQNLEKLIEEKKFREDLYYRINVIKIEVPPLRERVSELDRLMHELVDEFNVKYGVEKQLSRSLKKWIQKQEWPGNIRELRNFIERIHITSNENEITLEDAGIREGSEGHLSLEAYLEEVEKEYITEMYKKFPSSIKLAKQLKISQSTANRKINKYIKPSQ